MDGNLKFPYNSILNHELSSMASKSTEFTKSNHTFTGHNVIVEGKKIHFEKAGNGSHIILLMPGAIGTGKTDFLPQLNGLNPDLFTIIAWDPPGYGDSRPPEKDFNNFYANDAAMASKFMKVLSSEFLFVLVILFLIQLFLGSKLSSLFGYGLVRWRNHSNDTCCK